MTSQYGWKRFSDIVIYYIIIRDNIISPGILYSLIYPEDTTKVYNWTIITYLTNQGLVSDILFIKSDKDR